MCRAMRTFFLSSLLRNFIRDHSGRVTHLIALPVLCLLTSTAPPWVHTVEFPYLEEETEAQELK